MKSMMIAGVLLGAVAVPTCAFAQQGQPETRAHVAAQMQQLAEAGYSGIGGDTAYPADVEAAEQRVQKAAQGNGTSADTSGYGSQRWGSTSESGAREPKGPGSLYFGS